MTLAPVLAALSNNAWQERERARAAGISIREETLTENLLVSLFHLAGQASVVRKTTQAEEGAFGPDWLWALRHGDRWLSVWVQAKKGDVVHNGVAYRALADHYALAQGFRLLHNAARADAVPVYAFFNFNASPFSNPGPGVVQGLCPRSPVHRCPGALPWHPCAHAPHWPQASGSSLGVTIASAYHVVTQVLLVGEAAARRATFINRMTMPVECLLCPDWGTAGGAGPAGPDVDPPDDGNPFDPNLLLKAVRSLQPSPDALPDQQRNERVLARGVTQEIPMWATRVREGQDPFRGQSDQPAYAVVTEPA
jgi:hypothetical protein